MIRLARQTIRDRPRTFISPFLALVMSAALVTAAGVLMESGIRGAAEPDRYAGASIVVAAPQRMDNPVQDGESVRLPERVRIPVALAGELAAIPGVESVVADRALPVTVAVDGRILAAGDQTIAGQGWDSARLWPIEVLEGNGPQESAEVAIAASFARSADVEVGDELLISSTEETSAYRVSGLVTPTDRPLGRNIPLFFADDEGRRLSVDEERADALGVLREPGADIDSIAADMRELLDGQFDVLTGRDRARPESLDITMRNQEVVEFGGAFGVTAVMLAVFVVSATLGLSIMQRGREVALLRAVGATPRQVRRMIVGEAVLLALAAGVVGSIPGLLLGSGLFQVLQAEGIAPELTQSRLGLLPVVAAIVAGLIAASLAAFFAGRRAARIRPTAALSEAAIEPPRIGLLRFLLGVLLVGGGLALSVMAASLEGEEGASAVVIVLLTLIIGIAVLGPLLARGAGLLGGPIAASMSPDSGFLAKANLNARARRLASASTPLALAVALTLTMVGSLATEARAVEQQSRQRLIADRVLAGPAGVPSSVVHSAREIPGISTAVEVLPTSIGVDRRELFGERIFEMRPAAGLSAAGVGEVLDLDVQSGALSKLTSNEMAVSTEIARSAGVDVGDDVAVWLGDGTPLTLRVVATYARPLGLGDFVVDREIVAAHVTEPMPEQVLLSLDSGANDREVDIALAELAAETPGLEILDRSQVQSQRAQAMAQSAYVNYLFVAVLVAFVTLAMVNSLVLATAERSRELAMLRLVGATPRQLLRMVRLEALVLVAFGTVMGFAVAAATLVPFSLGIAGTPLPAVPFLFGLGVVAGAFVLGIAATELPARAALRRDPIEVISTPGW